MSRSFDPPGLTPLLHSRLLSTQLATVGYVESVGSGCSREVGVSNGLMVFVSVCVLGCWVAFAGSLVGVL